MGLAAFASKQVNLYRVQDRMGFTRRIAKKYHGLMITKIDNIEGVIAEISKWKIKT
jgi:hypothetical protein